MTRREHPENSDHLSLTGNYKELEGSTVASEGRGGDKTHQSANLDKGSALNGNSCPSMPRPDAQELEIPSPSFEGLGR